MTNREVHDSERLERWLKEHDPKFGTTGQEISSNLTDNESAKMKTAHSGAGYGGAETNKTV
jgi:hypothetical protein